MAFDTLHPHIDEIEKAFQNGESARSIAKRLGLSSAQVSRYKKAVWDLRGDAASAWNSERHKTIEQRLESGKAEIVDNLELLNLAKLRAREVLLINIGEHYTTSSGEDRTHTLASIMPNWSQATQMVVSAVKQELEVLGQSPANDLADAIDAMIQREQSARAGDDHGSDTDPETEGV